MNNFYKYSALGNKYIVLDSREHAKIPDKETIQRICDNENGIGSDGILFGPFEEKIPRVKIFNPDGSIAEKSGNGCRIFAKYLFEKGDVEKEFTLKTDGGDVLISIKDELISVNVGKAKFLGQERFKGMTLNIVSTGNPHCVIFLDKVYERFAKKNGPKIENLEFFPKKTNVQFVKVIDKDNLQMEIWERGAGYTLSSGTSASAALKAALELGLCNKKVKIHTPGGVMDVEMNNKEEIINTGMVKKMKQGVLQL